MLLLLVPLPTSGRNFPQSAWFICGRPICCSLWLSFSRPAFCTPRPSLNGFHKLVHCCDDDDDDGLLLAFVKYILLPQRSRFRWPGYNVCIQGLSASVAIICCVYIYAYGVYHYDIVVAVERLLQRLRGFLRREGKFDDRISTVRELHYRSGFPTPTGEQKGVTKNNKINSLNLLHIRGNWFKLQATA